MTDKVESPDVIEPDMAFVRRIMENGGHTLKKCFQCGNCSVVCEISPDNVPFPRKEMVWAQWGLKDKLLANADIWICHGCGDCTAHCPCGAKPADVLAAVRNISFSKYAGVEAMGRMLSSPSYLPVLFLVPAILITAMIFFASKPGFMSANPIVFSNMAPVHAIDMVFVPAVLFAAVSAMLGIKKFWTAIAKGSPGGARISSGLGKAAAVTALGILKHEKLGKCVTNAPRFLSHLMTMYGFLALTATTSLVAVMYWINKLAIAEVATTPLLLLHPVKILGNLGALAAVTGVTLIVARRYGGSGEKTDGTGYYDSHFIFILYGTILTGILSELFRLADVAAVAFWTYYVHLVLVFTLLAYAPFSKFAHMIYRFVAMMYANSVDRAKERIDDKTVRL